MSADLVIESVKPFTKRIGDQVFEGSNDTIIILGTDRAKNGPAGLGDGLGHVNAQNKGVGTGTIHIIAGRKNEDPDFSQDSAFIYVSKKTDVDENLGLSSVESKAEAGPAIVSKSDHIRIVQKKTLKIATEKGDEYIFMKSKQLKLRVGDNYIEVTDSKVTIDVGGVSKFTADKNNIKGSIGNSNVTMDSSSIVLSSPKITTVGGSENPRKDWEAAVMNAILTHTHMTSMGPSLPVQSAVPPPNSNIITDLQGKYQVLISQTLS